MLPDGFADLTSLVIQRWHFDELAKTDAIVWNNFLYPIFLGPTIRSAQAAYVKDVLLPFLDSENVNAILTDPIWSKKVSKVLNRELNNIKGTSGEGYKKAILNLTIQKVENLDLSHTIGEAINFFNVQQITAKKIKQLEADNEETIALVYSTACDVYDFGYVKSILWLYSCGIAKKIVPPNVHVLSFLDECGYSGFGWSKKPTPVSQIFTTACKCMIEVSTQVSEKLGVPITPKQAQTAVWYLQSCRGLLQSRRKKKFTPIELVNFLEIQNWDIPDLDKKLDDVEQLDDLEISLKNYFELL